MSPIVRAELRQSDVMEAALGVAAPGRAGKPSLLGGAPRPFPAEVPIEVRLVSAASWPECGRCGFVGRRRKLVPVRYPEACWSASEAKPPEGVDTTDTPE